MNIVVVNDYASVGGGADAVAIDSARALAQSGENVIFFCAVGPVDEKLDHENISVICLDQQDILDAKSGRAAFFGVWNRKAYASFARLLSSLDRNTSVVHIHSFTKALSSSVFRAARDSGFKVAYTMHDYFAACPNGGFYDYKKLENCPLRPMSPACIKADCDKREYAHKLWRCLRQAVQTGRGGVPEQVDALIAVSGHSEDIIRPYLPENARTFRVRNPISIENQGPERVAEKRTFAFMGRLGVEKGPEIFARAALEEGVDAAFIGDGPMRGQLEELLPEALFSGWLRPENAVRLLRESRALVFPSLWHETLGLGVMQAKALGIPAIVSRGCAAAELIEDGVDGFLFERGDAADLAQKLRNLRSDSKVKEMGRNAHRRYWDDPWTPGRHAQQLLDVYEGMLEQR